MLNRLFGKNFHDNVHVFALVCIGIGLSTSKIVISLATMLMILNVLLEANFKEGFRNIRKNHLFFWITGFFILHIVALLWTEDLNYALSDIRIKLPLLIIPLFVGAKPVTKQIHINLIVGSFVTATFLTSVINYLAYNHVIGNIVYDDIRGMSLFGSHIRYGIIVALAAGITLHFLLKQKGAIRIFLLLIVIWFLYYTYFSQVISGVLAITVAILGYLIFQAFSISKKIGIISLSVICLLPIGFFLLFNSSEEPESKIDYKNLERYTAQGNIYVHNFDSGGTVNGRPVFAYVSDYELHIAWNKRSELDYQGPDRKGQPVRHTLLRYMTSKDLKKDAEGLEKLSDEEIGYVENGIADIHETENGLMARIQGIKYQIDHHSDPNGHSLLQRLEYWKTGFNIIKSNWIIGVGTGDVQTAFDRQYEKDNSLLNPEFRLRAHNSYLTSWISFGIIGFIAFVGMIIFYLKSKIETQEFIPIMFILVATATFLLEDTLETQTGVTLFSFFYALFMINRKEEKSDLKN